MQADLHLKKQKQQTNKQKPSTTTAGGERMVEHSPQILASEEKAIVTRPKAFFIWRTAIETGVQEFSWGDPDGWQDAEIQGLTIV